jgi:Ca2+-binding EF-hand superfamily protein
MFFQQFKSLPRVICSLPSSTTSTSTSTRMMMMMMQQSKQSKQSKQSRLLTTATSNSIHKVQTAVEQFRIENYSQELPSRFKKEVIKAIDTEGNGNISVDAFTTLLSNIGASDTVSKEDVHNIINELGDGSSETIPTDQVFEIIL